MNLAIFQQSNQPVFLVGFMGSGKTYWGRQWAAALQKKFVDLDQLIENSEQLSVAEIFEKKGEEYFREKEADVLRSLQEEQDILISCGGGAPCFNDNMKWMNATGTTVFLEASPKFLLQNIVKEPLARPLLKNMNEAEMLFFIEKKLAERNEFYRQAKLVVNAEELNAGTIKEL